MKSNYLTTWKSSSKPLKYQEGKNNKHTNKIPNTPYPKTTKKQKPKSKNKLNPVHIDSAARSFNGRVQLRRHAAKIVCQFDYQLQYQLLFLAKLANLWFSFSFTYCCSVLILLRVRHSGEWLWRNCTCRMANRGTCWWDLMCFPSYTANLIPFPLWQRQSIQCHFVF